MSWNLPFTIERRGSYDHLKESKEYILSGALKEKDNNEDFALHEGKLQGQFLEKTRNITHKFSGKWIRNGKRACYLQLRSRH